MRESGKSQLSLVSNLKLAIFHLGSGMADILTTGVWNRIMVADLGFSATFVGLLVGLRYFLAPIGVIVGRYSDTHTVVGFRRLFWIWLGRAMMALSTTALGFSTAELVRRAHDAPGEPTPAALWLALVISFLLFSLGGALSGTTFLALIYDRAADHQRGRAVGLVWTFLLIGFAVGGVFFSGLLPSDASEGDLGISADSVLVMFLVGSAVFTALWFFSLLGEERRARPGMPDRPSKRRSIREDLALVWRNESMRYFLFYLTLSMLFAFLQDAVLEPFGGEVFAMEASATNRFAAYWGTMAIIGSFVVLGLTRRYAALTNSNVSQAGVIVLLVSYAIFSLAAFAEMSSLVRPGLIMLGVGYGVWNIGTLGLMMDMSPAGRAGAFLGFWTFCVTISRGAGVAGGGVIRDLALFASGDHALAYGAVFCCGIAGLLASWLALRRVNAGDDRADLSDDETGTAVFAQALD